MEKEFNRDLINFELIDTDGNGVIDRDEWKTACRNVSALFFSFPLYI